MATLGNDGTPGAPINTYSTAAGEEAGTVYTVTATVSGSGTSGGTNYAAGLDYLTVAPVTNLAATPNNHGIARDNSATTADLTGTGDALSATALAQAGISPGTTYTTGAATFRIPDITIDGNDNILSRGSVLTLDQPVTGATHLYLLVTADLPYFDHGSSAARVDSHVYLYLISIPISATRTLSQIVLPAQTVPGSTTVLSLHVLAATTS